MHLPFQGWIGNKPNFSQSGKFVAVYEGGVLAIASLTTMQHVWHAELKTDFPEAKIFNQIEDYLPDNEPRDQIYRNERFQLSFDGRIACCILRELDTFVPVLISSDRGQLLLENFRSDTHPEIAFLSDDRLICKRNHQLSIISTNPVELIQEIDISELFLQTSSHDILWRVSRSPELIWFFAFNCAHVEVCAIKTSDASIVSRHRLQMDGWPNKNDLLDIQITDL